MTNTQPHSGRFFAYNVAFNILSLVAPLLFAFVSTPLLVRGLGVEDYGYYSIVLAAIGFAFTTGIARTPAKYIPEKRANGRPAELKSLLSAALLLTLMVGLIEGIGLALLSPVLISKVLGVPAAEAGMLKTAIYLACLIGAVMMLSQLFQSALQGIHRFRVYALITIAASLSITAGSVLIAQNGFTYRDVFVLNLAVTVIAAAAFFIFAKAGVPELGLPITIDAAAVKTVARFAGSIFIYQSITSIFHLFERAYILRNHGPEALTYYTIPLMLGIYLHGFILAVSQVTIPKFNERLSDESALLTLYTTLTKLVVSGSVYLALFYYLFGSELLSLWLGQDFAARSYRLLVIDGASFALIAMLIPAWILSESARRPGINASSPLVTYLIGMIAIVFLGSTYRIEGVAAGRLVGTVAALPIIFIVERLVFGKVRWGMWLFTVGRIAAASCLMYLASWAVNAAFDDSWLALVVVSLAASSCFWGLLILLRFINRIELRSAFSSPAATAEDSEMIMPVQ